MKPTVYIELDAWRDIRKYVMTSTLECSMLGEVESKDNTFIITRVFLPKQTRSAAYTKITNDGIDDLLSRDDINPLKIKAWFHSHVNMGVSPSAVDKTQAAELMSDCDWFICGIFNKKNEYSMYIHWMGMEIEANLEILFDGTYDIEAVKKELEDATIVSEVVPYQPKPAKYKKKKNEYGNTFPWKLSYETHVEQNAYITKTMHEIYEQNIDALPYNSAMAQISSKFIGFMDDDTQMIGSELYSGYLDEIEICEGTHISAINEIKELWELIKENPMDWLDNPFKYTGYTYE